MCALPGYRLQKAGLRSTARTTLYVRHDALYRDPPQTRRLTVIAPNLSVGEFYSVCKSRVCVYYSLHALWEEMLLANAKVAVSRFLTISALNFCKKCR